MMTNGQKLALDVSLTPNLRHLIIR